MQYRRAFIPGDSYFFTLVTYQRRRLFVDDKTIEVLREAFRQVRAKRPFSIDAGVLLPDHLHSVWTLPPDDTAMCNDRRIGLIRVFGAMLNKVFYRKNGVRGMLCYRGMLGMSNGVVGLRCANPTYAYWMKLQSKGKA